MSKLKHIDIEDVEGGWSINFSFNTNDKRPWLSVSGLSLTVPENSTIQEIGEMMATVGATYSQKGKDIL